LFLKGSFSAILFFKISDNDVLEFPACSIASLECGQKRSVAPKSGDLSAKWIEHFTNTAVSWSWGCLLN
jgi:hypothetical protein